MDLTRGWSETLVAVRALTDSLTRTAHYTNRLTTSVDTMLPRLVVSLHERLATADTLMRELRAVAPTAVASMDSAQAMIADSRRLMADVDRTLAARDPQMGRVLANLDTTTALLNHFVREVTRRPGRLVSGVTPPDRLDPARAAERRRRACGRGPCTATTDSVTAPAADSSGTK